MPPGGGEGLEVLLSIGRKPCVSHMFSNFTPKRNPRAGEESSQMTGQPK